MASGTEHAANAAGAAADMAQGGGGGAGMPQLDVTTFGNQIFWLVVTLVVIYLVFSRVALPRIAGVLAERQSSITNDIATAEELKLAAQKAEDAYNRALADARAEAAKIVAEAKAEIGEEVKAAQAEADAEIAARTAESEKAIADIRASAVDNVKTVAKDAAEEIVAAFGVKADAAAITNAITERMKG